jgi:transcription initiation factor TFIIB
MELSCPLCSSSNIVEDAEISGLFCMECGNVVLDNKIDERPEIQDISDNAVTTAGRFVSANDSRYSTTREQLEASMAKSGSVLINHTDQHTRNRMQAEHIVSRICRACGLMRVHESMSITLMDQITEHKFGQGRWVDLLAAACVYVSARRDGKPITLMDISEAIKINVFVIGRVCSRIQRAIGVKLEPPKLSQSVDRVLGVLPIPPEHKRTFASDSLILLDLAKQHWLTVGRRPYGLIAGVIKVLCQAREVKMSDPKIASACGVAKTVIARRTQELKQMLVTLGSQLPWGSNLTTKIVLKHLDSIIEYKDELMALASTVNPEQSPTLDDDDDDINFESPSSSITDITSSPSYLSLPPLQFTPVARSRTTGSSGESCPSVAASDSFECALSSSPSTVSSRSTTSTRNCSLLQSQSSLSMSPLPPSLQRSQQATRKRLREYEEAHRRVSQVLSSGKGSPVTLSPFICRSSTPASCISSYMSTPTTSKSHPNKNHRNIDNNNDSLSDVDVDDCLKTSDEIQATLDSDEWRINHGDLVDLV